MTGFPLSVGNRPHFAIAKIFLLATTCLFLLIGIIPAAQALNPPSLSPSTGSFSGSQAVTMTASAGNIYYTTDGSAPTTQSNKYISPILVNRSTQVNAVAYQNGIYSAVTTIYLDIDSALAPVLQTGLAFRLTSSFGVVTDVGSPPPVRQWIDLSGNGYTASAATANQPTLINPIGGIAGVSFNGTSQFLTLPSGFSSFPGATIFMVVQPNSPSTGARFFDLGNGSASNNIYMSQPSTNGADLHIYNGSTDSSVSSASATTLGQYQLLEISYNGTNTATLFTNAAQDAQSTSMQTPNVLARSRNYIGQASAGGNLYSGKIAELLIYSTQLTASQRIAIEAYFIQKYQFLSVTPGTPIISVATGTLNGPTEVAIASQPGTTTYITTDGSTPTTSSTIYNGPFTVYYSQTVKAMSVSKGVQSSVAAATYTLDSSQWPAPNPADTAAPTINLQVPVPSL
jgi:hypothetical protein